MEILNIDFFCREDRKAFWWKKNGGQTSGTMGADGQEGCKELQLEKDGNAYRVEPQEEEE